MKNTPARSFYVEKFIEYMDNHPVHASILVISFCAGAFVFICGLVAVAILLAKSGNLSSIIQVISSIFIGT